jgi:N-acetylmuramoyl-L-alanine amidase
MGLHLAEDNLQVAKRENAVIEHESNYEAHYDGYDPNSDEGHIMLSMFQNAFLDQSISLANLIEDEFKTHGQRVSRGVKQAGFLVLRSTVMPSVLIEAGFLNHSKEESILTSEEGKDRTAAAIFNAFTKYKLDMDKMVAHNQTSMQVEAIPASYTETQISPETTSEPVVSQDETESINYVERAKKEMERMQTQKNSGSKSEEKIVAAPAKPKVSNQKPVVKEAANLSEAKKQTEQEPVNKIVPREKKLEYAVQLSASAKKIRSGGGKWDQVDNVMIRFENNLYKYQVGALNSYEDALAIKAKLKSLGFADCFVVAYYNDQLIQVKEALALSH